MKSSPIPHIMWGKFKRLPETRLEKHPRMADFALWATACETALWPAGNFRSAYCENRDEAVENVIDATTPFFWATWPK